MGLSPSKRVSQTLQDSAEFNSACDSVFNECLSMTQYAFPGIKSYQLLSATEKLHALLFSSLSVIYKWVPSAPDRSQVDRAYETVVSRRSSTEGEGEETLDRAEFGVFAIEVFAGAIVSAASKEVLKMLPVGVVGIAGVGVVTKSNKKVIGAAIASYALAVATSIYLGL